MTHPSILRALARRAKATAEVLDFCIKHLEAECEKQPEGPTVALKRRDIGRMLNSMERQLTEIRRFPT
jgi:hypothetical protein